MVFKDEGDEEFRKALLDDDKEKEQQRDQYKSSQTAEEGPNLESERFKL